MKKERMKKERVKKERQPKESAKDRPAKSKFKKALKRVLVTLGCIAGFLAFLTILFDVIVLASGGSGIRESAEKVTLEKPDCIMVLGCSVKPDGTPSDMLRDRIETGVALYKAGVAPKILMSGDHGSVNYNEVGCMKAYAEQLGVPSEDIFLDHAGFCTYDSVVRAKEVFGVKKMVIVTQKYHLFRAVFIAKAFGVEAEGVPADLHRYHNQLNREIREIFGRCKDLLNTIFRPDPKYLGEPIDITGDGSVTNDPVTPVVSDPDYTHEED